MDNFLHEHFRTHITQKVLVVFWGTTISIQVDFHSLMFNSVNGEESKVSGKPWFRKELRSQNLRHIYRTIAYNRVLCVNCMKCHYSARLSKSRNLTTLFYADICNNTVIHVQDNWINIPCPELTLSLLCAYTISDRGLNSLKNEDVCALKMCI